MISSVSNPAVKEVALWQTKAKARRESGFFVAEGLRLVREAPPEDVVRAYATESFAASEEGAALCEKLRAETVSEPVMERMSDTKTPQGILAVVRQRRYEPSGLTAAEGPLLVLGAIFTLILLLFSFPVPFHCGK